MNEQLHRFGADARLCGILHTPAGNSSRTVVIFITAGLLHKPGPFRLYVELSRTLAAAGTPALRFDLSGIGESGRCTSGESAEQAAVTDVCEAIDWLNAEFGFRRFILAGLCSGAEVAHRAAVKDERVCGMIAMDGYIVRTPAYYWWHYLPRVFSLSKWLDFAGGWLHRLLARTALANGIAPEDEALAFWEGPGPDRSQLAAEFTSLCDRRVRQLQIFSGGSGDCSYQRQFHDAFHDVDFNGLVDVRFLAETDHVYVLHADRLRLVQLIADWISEHFSVFAVPERARTSARQAGLPEEPAFPSSLSNVPHSIKLAGRRNVE